MKLEYFAATDSLYVDVRDQIEADDPIGLNLRHAEVGEILANPWLRSAGG